MQLIDKTKVKICGVNSADAFDAVVAAEADFVGFVFFPPSPRYVTPAQAAALSARHGGGPKRVGLFVEPSGDDIRAALADADLEILQIYADAARCRALAAEFSMPVWQAIGVGKQADLPVIADGLDGFVIEAKAPAGATRPGGNATAMDWALLAGWRAPSFWLLGGGLTPNNVAAAISVTGAPGVDVSSGVETAPGVKSPELIRQFVMAARGQSS
jgi:phosphoribosylanthranilate isomerase